jgi:hypothetical protein
MKKVGQGLEGRDTILMSNFHSFKILTGIDGKIAYIYFFILVRIYLIRTYLQIITTRLN